MQQHYIPFQYFCQHVMVKNYWSNYYLLTILPLILDLLNTVFQLMVYKSTVSVWVHGHGIQPASHDHRDIFPPSQLSGNQRLENPVWISRCGNSTEKEERWFIHTALSKALTVASACSHSVLTTQSFNTSNNIHVSMNIFVSSLQKHVFLHDLSFVVYGRSNL